MKGLLLIYAIVTIGSIVALRLPTIGLLVCVGFSVLRPEALWGWAGNLNYMTRIVAIPMLIGWAFRGFGSWRLGRARSIVISLVLYTVWLMISSSQGIDTEAAWWSVLEFSKTLLPVLVGVTMMTSEKETRRLLWVMVLAQAYVSFDMNMLYLGGYNKAQAEGFGGMDNNCFGISLLSTLGAALALVLSSKKLILKAVAAVAMLLILHTILLTFSRGAFVGLLCVGFTALVVLPKKLKYVGTIVLAGVITYQLIGPELSDRLQSTFAPQKNRDDSAEGRIDLWRDCFTLISEEPFFGVGPTGWPKVASQFGWPEGKEAHSLWIQTTAEIGVPGVLFLMMFYLLTIKRLWPIARERSPGRDPTVPLIATGIILSLVGFATSAQFVSLTGLEAPFSVTMVGATLLKIRSLPELATEPASEAPKKIDAPLATATASLPAKPSLNSPVPTAGRATRVPVLPAASRAAHRGTSS